MNKKKFEIGYTQGTYDLFHVGHLNLLENAKEQCEKLIVGVNSNELVKQYKNKTTIVSDKDRARIVKGLKVVDDCIIVSTLDKKEIYDKYIKYNAIFIGDDWKGNERWKKTEEELAKIGVPVIYLPHTNGISTTQLSTSLNDNEKERISNGEDE